LFNFIRRKSLVVRTLEQEKRRRKQDKWRLSPKAAELRHTFFIFLFSSFNTGPLSTLASHKNDYQKIFLMDYLGFMPNSLDAVLFMVICRYTI
jgi:hypothetical protein